MTDSQKLRVLSGRSILPLGAVLFIASFMPAILRDGNSPIAGMVAVVGLLAIGAGIPLSIATTDRLTERGARGLCLVLEPLILAAAGGALGILVQRASFFATLGVLPVTLVIVFVALFCFALIARLAIAQQSSAAFLSDSESLFTIGGRTDPLSFLFIQVLLIIAAAVVGVFITAQRSDSREGSILALALFLAVLPLFVRAEVANCVKRWRDETVAWPSYGVLAWAGFLVLGLFAGSHLFLIQVLCCAASVVACISWHVVSRKRRRRGFFRRALGYVAFGLGSMLPLSGAFIVLLGRVQKVSPNRTATLFIIVFLIAAGLIAGARYLVFRRDEKVDA